MRRLIILVLMLGGMQLILPLGARGYGGQWLLIFGFLIVAAEAVGGLAGSIRLPKIVGYLLAGLLFGPSFLNTVDAESIRQLAPVSSLAIALIAFLAGAELRWAELKERGVLILKILAAEMSLTFVAVAGLLVALRDYVPFLQGSTIPVALVLSMMFASVAVVHSPAVTMALLTETRARGPVARSTLGVVLVSDVAVILLFSSTLALARAVAPPAAAGAGPSLGLLVWEIAGALVVGAALGGVVAVYLRWVRRELFLFAVLVAFFGAELARLVHVETLLMLLTAGFVSENLSESERGEALRIAMERSAAPVFVVFFALAGASMEVSQILVLWPLLIPLILMRPAGPLGRDECRRTLGGRLARVAALRVARTRVPGRRRHRPGDHRRRPVSRARRRHSYLVPRHPGREPDGRADPLPAGTLTERRTLRGGGGRHRGGVGQRYGGDGGGRAAGADARTARLTAAAARRGLSAGQRRLEGRRQLHAGPRQLLHQHPRPLCGIPITQHVPLGIEAGRTDDPARRFGPSRGRIGGGGGGDGGTLGVHRREERLPPARPVLDQGTVPQRVQVGAAPEGLQLVEIAPPVVGKAAVQWLVHITHQVHDVLERLEALRIVGLRGEYRQLPFDRANHAVAVHARSSRLEVTGTVSGKIDIVPRRGGGRARLVGPGRDGGERCPGFECQQPMHLRQRLRRQVVLCVPGDELVSFGSPGPRGTR
ncbi:MAG: cation:proton antiporter [Gemmatimonadetes bacterium]|nr:cation:proton antiporter [Gemmatimonadota bacterium]